MEIRELKSFILAAKLNSISKAADTLGVGQPTVTSHIKRLENSLGIILFDRVKRPIKLTLPGEKLLNLASPLIDGIDLIFKDFLDHICDYANKTKIVIKLNPKYLIPFAYINEIIFKFFINKEPTLTIDSLKMSSKKMFFSSEKAKKKLRYRPRSVKSAINDSVKWFKELYENM